MLLWLGSTLTKIKVHNIPVTGPHNHPCYKHAAINDMLVKILFQFCLAGLLQVLVQLVLPDYKTVTINPIQCLCVILFVATCHLQSHCMFVKKHKQYTLLFFNKPQDSLVLKSLF